MQNTLGVNMKYLEHVTQAMDMITKPAPKDDGHLALGTDERREQEEYFGEGNEPEREDDSDE